MNVQDMREKKMSNQEIKADNGKPRLSLVPMEIIRNIARIREFGLKKYKEKESWKSVEVERYRDALLRHTLLYIEDPYGLDDESGLPHLWHLACNVAFLCELEKGKFKNNKLDLSEFKPKADITVTNGSGIQINKVDEDGFDWDKGDYIVYEKDMEKKN